MKMPPEYLVSLFFIALGLIAFIYKPFYYADKLINNRKVSIYHGWALLVFGLILLVLRIVLGFIGLSNWWPLGLFIGTVILMISMFRLKKACIRKDKSENT